MKNDKTEKYETVELDLNNDDILTLALLAHERDITLNQLIVDFILMITNREEPFAKGNE